MKLKVRYFTSLRELIGRREEKVNFSGKTVKGLIEHLSERHGDKFVDYIYDETGGFRKYLVFLVNGKNIKNLDGFETKLKSEDVFAILPPVGGG